MADALISPAVGATLWVATGSMVVYCSRKVTLEHDDRKVALMGVLGAFIFAAQMINFTIPGTGSSGHIGGGLLLAVLLGPHAAFLVMASVLGVQALFFADGGLLALGCNIFNLAFFPCFVAYPLLYRTIVKNHAGRNRIWTGTIIAAVIGLQLGSLGVVFETVVSGIADLPFLTFLTLMQPIHLAIGVIEGGVTAAVILFIRNARPEILTWADNGQPPKAEPLRNVAIAFLAMALVTGCLFSWFASAKPDGLEWTIAKVSHSEELTPPADTVHQKLAAAQKKMALMPGYDFKQEGDMSAQPSGWVRPQAGTSLSGLSGTFVILLLTTSIWLLLRRKRTV